MGGSSKETEEVLRKPLDKSGFTFAYLKELILSSVVQWISNDRSMSMDEIVLDQVGALRRQVDGNGGVKSSNSSRFRLLKRAANLMSF